MRPIDADALVLLIEADQLKVPGSRIFYDKETVLGMIAEVPTLSCETEADDVRSDEKN